MPTCGIRSPVVDSLMVGVAEEDMLSGGCEDMRGSFGSDKWNAGLLQMRNNGGEDR